MPKTIRFNSTPGGALRLLPLAALLAPSALGVEKTAPAWTLDFQERMRVEWRDSTATFNRSTPSTGNGSWLLQRFRAGVRGCLTANVALYAQVQDAREFFSDRPAVPYVAGAEGDDAFDLRQAYLDFHLAGGAATLRLGRQALAFGDERLVGPLDWNNFGRTFDAARLTLSRPDSGATLDLFASSVVRVHPASDTERRWSFNRADGDDLFAGAYGRISSVAGWKYEPYVLWRRKTDDAVYTAAGNAAARPYDIPQRIVTLGLRWQSPPPEKFGGFDADGEAAWQAGKARGRAVSGSIFAYPGPRDLDHRAWALHLGGGYTANAGGVPLRFGVEFNHATGDRDPADGRNGAFLNLFPTNHKFYGMMDAFAWKNMREVAVSLAAKPGESTRIKLEHHFFALATAQDAWYRANAITAVRPLTAGARAAPRLAGQETDLVVSHTFAKRLTLEIGYAHFFAGPYLEQTPGGSDDADFGYVQTIFAW